MNSNNLLYIDPNNAGTYIGNTVIISRILFDIDKVDVRNFKHGNIDPGELNLECLFHSINDVNYQIFWDAAQSVGPPCAYKIQRSDECRKFQAILTKFAPSFASDGVKVNIKLSISGDPGKWNKC